MWAQFYFFAGFSFLVDDTAELFHNYVWPSIVLCGYFLIRLCKKDFWENQTSSDKSEGCCPKLTAGAGSRRILWVSTLYSRLWSVSTSLYSELHPGVKYTFVTLKKRD